MYFRYYGPKMGTLNVSRQMSQPRCLSCLRKICLCDDDNQEPMPPHPQEQGHVFLQYRPPWYLQNLHTYDVENETSNEAPK